jgi:hypothetical protein
MILAIDFDGVIHDHHNPVEGRRMGPPMPGTKETLEKFKAIGDKIIVHSVWANQGAGIKTIVDYMEYWALPFDDVTNVKPDADYYIDDKALRFTSWSDVAARIGLDREREEE